jgi:flagellar hook-associated protein 1 FlgK
MSLTGALNIGRSALAVQQAAIQVTGNNIANAGNADYTRQTTDLKPIQDVQIRPGVFLGQGVTLDGIHRQIDEALQGRLRGSFSDAESADTLQQWYGRVEATFNELGDDDLSTKLSTFFTSWSNLANQPQDPGLRQVVLQNGEAVAKWFNDLRGQLGGLQTDVDARLKAQAGDANNLAQQIADLNANIVVAEGGSGADGNTANGLRDQRDAVLGKLSKLMDVRTVPQANGSLNVYVGSEPLVLGSDNRGVELKQQTVNGKLTSTVVFKATQGKIPVKSGQLGGLVEVRERVDGVIDQVDAQAHNLIFELNKLHAGGQGLEGFSTVSASNTVDDATVALNNATCGLDYTPTNGSFVVHVKQRATGLVTSTLVNVDLDGLNANDTTLNSLATDIDNIAGISASVSAGRLNISADSNAVELSFSQDTSGVLAALGVNSFYTGNNAWDIALNPVIKDKPQLLAAAKNGEPTDNQTARAIADLESTKLGALGGSTLKDAYQATINQLGAATADAKTSAEAAAAVKDTLQAQREALSGVSLDEEAVNLMRQQRAFQGAARLIAAVDEMMQTVLNMT